MDKSTEKKAAPKQKTGTKTNVSGSGKNLKDNFAFSRDNYKWLIIGVLITFVGFLLMTGGGSDDPNVYDGEKLFSPVRITISPILILGGYVVVLFAIMKKPKAGQES